MDNSFSEKKRWFIVISAAAGLFLLSFISYAFLDKQILAWQVQDTEYFGGIFLAKAVVLLGKVWAPAWLLLCWALLAGRRQEALVALLALLLLALVVPPLKATVHRPRPRDVAGNQIQGNDKVTINKYSFPSGDTASIFAIGMAIMPFVSLLEVCIIFILAGCVGALRVASSAHYLSDVFAGAAIGILIGYLTYYLTITKPFLKDLVKLLSPKITLLAIIIIPSVIGLSEKHDDFLVFLKFYPLIVIALYLLYKIRKPQKSETPK